MRAHMLSAVFDCGLLDQHIGTLSELQCLIGYICRAFGGIGAGFGGIGALAQKKCLPDEYSDANDCGQQVESVEHIKLRLSKHSPA